MSSLSNIERPGTIYDPEATKQRFLQRAHFEMLKVAKLGVDHAHYQQPLVEQRVERIRLKFNPDLVTVVLVSRRKDGSEWIMDGQHRHEAMVRLAIEDVPALVWTDLTIEDEARIFALYNADRTKPQAVNLFRALVTAKDPSHLTVKTMVQAFGYTIGDGRGIKNGKLVPGELHFPTTLLKLERMDVLQDVLLIMSKAWGYEQEDAMRGELWFGLGGLLSHFPEVTIAELTTSLQKTNAATLHAKVKLLRVSSEDKRVWVAWFEMLRRQYNVGRTTRVLPPTDIPHNAPAIWYKK